MQVGYQWGLSCGNILLSGNYWVYAAFILQRSKYQNLQCLSFLHNHYRVNNAQLCPPRSQRSCDDSGTFISQISSEGRYLHRECSCRSVSPSPLLVLDPRVSPLNKEVLYLTAESSVLRRGFCRLCWLFSRMLEKHHVFRPTAPVYLAFFL